MSTHAASPDPGGEFRFDVDDVPDDSEASDNAHNEDNASTDEVDERSTIEPDGVELPVEEVDTVESEADLVVRERDEYLDTLRRLQAEFDNYRKRMARQQADSVSRAAESLLERLLPVLDALDLAVTHSEGEDEASQDRQALIQITSLLRDILAKEGLERIDGIDVPFDPTIHDAVVHLDLDDGLAGTGTVVSEVLRAGYQLKGKVVRPAMVQVHG